MAVPAGYVSEHWISSSATIPGSIASLGLTPGEYLTTFSFGGVSDTVLVHVAAGPEPALTGLTIAGALTGLQSSAPALGTGRWFSRLRLRLRLLVHSRIGADDRRVDVDHARVRLT